MYHVSTQGVDEHMINFYLKKERKKGKKHTKPNGKCANKKQTATSVTKEESEHLPPLEDKPTIVSRFFQYWMSFLKARKSNSS